MRKHAFRDLPLVLLLLIVLLGAVGASSGDETATPESKLWAAAKKGDLAATQALLAAGADPNAPYEFGFTALLYAAIAGHAEVVEALLEAGADVRTQDSLNHFTPLSMATTAGHCDAVEILVDHGADPNSRDLYSGKTALWFAAMKGFRSCVESMVASNRVTALTLEEALEVARQAGRTEVVGVLEAALRAADRPVLWPQFRGVGATGLADGEHAPTSWDLESGENVAWKTPIPGLGHASPVVAGDRLFVATAVTAGEDPSVRSAPATESVAASGRQSWRLLALDRRQGGVLWERTAVEGESETKRHPVNSFASATPATDGRHVAALLGNQVLFVYTVEGDLSWKRDLGRINTGPMYDAETQWGNASSPVLFRDLVIVQVDRQEDSFIAAYDLDTGEQRWKVARDEPSSWGTPTVYAAEGEEPEVITNGTYRIRSYQAETGEELWSLATGNSMITAPTPIVGLGMVFVTNGFRPLKPIYAIRTGARGDISLAPDETSNEHVVWSLKGGGSYFLTPLLYGEHLYVLSDSGILRNYYAMTGEIIYRERVSKSAARFFASPVAADGNLFLTSQQGEVFVIPSGLEFEVLTTLSIGEECYATPAIAGGMLYVRGRRHVFGLGKAPPLPGPPGVRIAKTGVAGASVP